MALIDRHQRFVSVVIWLAVGAACGSTSSAPDATAGDGPTSEDAPALDAAAATVDASVSTAVPDQPTWHAHVAPVVSLHCAGCHRPGGIAPFALTSYQEARPRASSLVGMVKAGLMPPWHAVETDECRPRFPWKHDLRLSDAKKLLLERWAAAGAPEGDPATAAPLPAPVTGELADRNQRVTMARPYQVDPGGDQFRCFPLPHVFDQDVWLTGLQVVPGNTKVVHHVLVWLDEKKRSDGLAGDAGSYQCFGAPGFDSALLGAWAPGAVPIELPPGAGLPVPKGSRIVINVHYHPTGEPQMDASSIDLRWTATKTPLEATLALVGNARKQEPSGDGLAPGPGDPPSGPSFLIPAGARDHVETMRFTIPERLAFGAFIFAAGTHMHYVGTDMKIEIDRSKRKGGAPAGEPQRECLLQTPRWDFHWQRGYQYDAPLEKLPTLSTGDVLHLRCKYDNSLDNPHVAAALAEQGLKQPRRVELGEETLDEMCLGVFGIAYWRP